MRGTTLALFLPAACARPEAEPEVCPDDSGVLALISQARSGEMAAFEKLKRRYERLVLMTALRYLNGNVADAQDAAQTAFLRLHRSLGQFRSDASFPAWLHRITVNVCHDMNRKSQRRAEVDLTGIARTLPAVAVDPVEDDKRRMEAVKAGLARLGEKNARRLFCGISNASIRRRWRRSRLTNHFVFSMRSLCAPARIPSATA